MTAPGLDNDAEARDLALWSDNPALIDLLSFSSVAGTVVSALLDDRLDPVVLSISGRWGSGKTTVLQLIEMELSQLNRETSKILVVRTDPWRFDPATGVKETLIGEVLSELESEVNSRETTGGGATKVIARLMRRVDWAKAVTLAAKASLLMQIPSPDDLTKLVRDTDGGDESKPRGLEAFRSEFSELMNSAELGYIKRLIVLVDDLDRCLPPAVIEALEGIRLFLAVPKMSFVIAADEERVADAIRSRYGNSANSDQRPPGELEEEPAKLYLHKIVHTTVPLPSLSRFDTEAYLLLLQVMPKVDESQLKALVEQCDALRKDSKSLAELAPSDGVDLGTERAFAERLTPILYEKLQGNPRRIKRFLNDLHVRQSIANRRGINLQAGIVAKMMVLEQLLPDEFARLLAWLSGGTLRIHINRLEEAARIPDEVGDGPEDEERRTRKTPLNGQQVKEAQNPDEEEFGDPLLRWAKLEPPLHDVDLSGYLHLAASFAGETLLDKELPERLRDLAASLISSSRVDQHSVTDEDLRRIPREDASSLLRHLGRIGRDRPADQRKAVEAILRITRQQYELADECRSALGAIPGDEVRPPTVLLFQAGDEITRPVLTRWKSQTSSQTTLRAIERVLRGRTRS